MRHLIGEYLPKYGDVAWQSGVGCVRVTDTTFVLDYAFYACLSQHSNVHFTSNDGGSNALASMKILNYSNSVQDVDELFLALFPAGQSVDTTGHDYDAEVQLLLSDGYSDMQVFDRSPCIRLHEVPVEVPRYVLFILLLGLHCDRYTFAVVEPFDEDDILMPSAFCVEVCLTDADSLEVGRQARCCGQCELL